MSPRSIYFLSATLEDGGLGNSGLMGFGVLDAGSAPSYCAVSAFVCGLKFCNEEKVLTIYPTHSNCDSKQPDQNYIHSLATSWCNVNLHENC